MFLAQDQRGSCELAQLLPPPLPVSGLGAAAPASRSLQANAPSPCVRLTRLGNIGLSTVRVIEGRGRIVTNEGNSRRAINQAEATGALFLPAIVACGVGGYKLTALPWPNTNGQLLLILGALTLIAAFGVESRPRLALFAVPLAIYTFTIIGCLALGLAIYEASGWWTIGEAVFWVLFGWYVSSNIGRSQRLAHTP